MRKHELPFKVLAAQQAELTRLREENERLNQLILYWEEETADAKRVRDGWIDQAEAAEAKWAMLTANQAGHPAMCCGQCHQAIVDAEAKLAEALYEMTAAWGGHTDPHTVGEMARAICDEMKAVREEIARETNFKQLAYAREEAAEAKLALREDHDAELTRLREENERLKNPAYIFNEHAAAIERAEAAEAKLAESERMHDEVRAICAEAGVHHPRVLLVKLGGERVRNTPVSAENGQPSIPDKP